MSSRVKDPQPNFLGSMNIVKGKYFIINFHEVDYWCNCKDSSLTCSPACVCVSSWPYISAIHFLSDGGRAGPGLGKTPPTIKESVGKFSQ